MSETEKRKQAEGRGELAEDRTNLAEDRTLLANERTFAGWSRTALASIGVGLGFQALFREIEPTWVAKAISTIFVCLGVFIIWNAEQRAAAVLERLSETRVKVMGVKRFRGIAAVMSAGAILTAAALWLFI